MSAAVYIPEHGERVRDVDYGCIGTVTGERSGLSIAVTWDQPHPFTDDTTLSIFDDLEPAA